MTCYGVWDGRGQENTVRSMTDGGDDDGARNPAGHHAPHGFASAIVVEVPLDDPAVRRSGRICLVRIESLLHPRTMTDRVFL